MSPTRRKPAMDPAVGVVFSGALVRAVTPCRPSSAAIARARAAYPSAPGPPTAASSAQVSAVPGPVTDRLGAAAQDAGVYVVMGVDEREPHGATIYNTIL
jgi:hypothetical protein